MTRLTLIYEYFRNRSIVQYTLLILVFICGNLSLGRSQESIFTERKYLSGIDKDHTVEWDFYCTAGRNSGEWTKIAVPSCWEQEGFGNYDYGRDYRTYGKKHKFSEEKGVYKYEFEVSENWSDREILLVFEGVMTDATVKLNGKLVGPIHQGAFYRFKYPISNLINFGVLNSLEVTVSKMSENMSVNRAERYADYWIFGGIFRPVYLESNPKEYIEHTAIVAESDGQFEFHLRTNGSNEERRVEVDILDDTGEVITTEAAKLNPRETSCVLTGHVEDPDLWSTEFPHLYRARIRLMKEEIILNQKEETFGFRSIEIRSGDGVYINGHKIKFKGINRHCFWPESGRTLSRTVDRLDIELIKEMNMNAVRCAHYPPDKSFLELCDSMGLYVINELAGWQNAYDTEVGRKLVHELVERDVNHPSIIFWSNGNEGGTNKDLDADFSLYDPSDRPVIHAHHRPGNSYNGIETNHYEKYYSTESILNDSLIYMPTEFLHAQDDGGAAAGLFDFWELMWNSPRSGGGFLWALIDEGIVRTDLNGVIDVNRVNAPDGVLGPYREKEGSFNALKEIFSPVVIDSFVVNSSFDGRIEVKNRFDFTNLNSCRIRGEFLNFNSPYSRNSGHHINHQFDQPMSDVPPGGEGLVQLPLPANWQDNDAFYLKVFDPSGRMIYQRSYRIAGPDELFGGILAQEIPSNQPTCTETDTSFMLTSDNIRVSIRKDDGMLDGIEYSHGLNPLLKNGPTLQQGTYHVAEMQCTVTSDGPSVVVNYAGELNYVHWTLRPDQWLQMDYRYEMQEERYPFLGVSFDLPESNVIGVKWLGNGPYRVWKNRLHGVTTDVWQSLYNNTHTGTTPWHYPEFKGYFSQVNWIEFNMVEGRILVGTTEPNLFVRLFDFYSLSGPIPHPILPSGNISFLDAIPPTGTKLATGLDTNTDDLGPMSELNRSRPVERSLYFYFGNHD